MREIVLSGGSIRQFPVFWWGNRCWPAARGPGGLIGDADRNRLFHCHRRRLLGHRISSAGRECFLDLLPPIAAPRLPNLQPAMLGTVTSPQHGLGPVQSSATFPAVPPEVSVSPPVAPPTPTQQPAASVPFPEGGLAVGWRTPLKLKETRHWGGMSRVSPAIDETRSSPGSAVRLRHKTELREPRQIGQATQDPTGTDTAR